ncbi:MAG: chitin deacetylase [Amphiamblys sp. WSBS2006]|nr:MAG: chitin deacetylase [Amphiamblys sp. WSBS2006]
MKPRAVSAISLLLANTLAAAPVRYGPINPVDPDIGKTGLLYHNCRIPNAIALTYDDGPSYGPTVRILKVLRKQGVKATFFVIGKQIEEHKRVLRVIHKEGHVIGNHTWTHPHLDKMDEERIKKEIRKTDEEVKSVIGKTPRFFRPPYGAYNKKSLRIISGFFQKKIIMWNLDTMDWEYEATPVSIIGGFKKEIERKCSMCHSWIPLQHDIHETTAYTQNIVIDYLKKCGYRFVTMDECIGEKGIKYMEDVEEKASS